MSNIRIEILDYSGMTSSGGGGGSSLNNVVTSGVGWQTGFSVPNNTTLQYTNPGYQNFNYFQLDTSSLVNGQSYTINYEITSYIGTGTNPQVLVVYLNGASTPSGVHYGTTGMQSLTWTHTTVNSSVQFQALNTSSFTISNISISGFTASSLGSVDLGNSIVGELDITDHSDFPLAMTFQISDIKDITSTSGDYSKTFKIPATKNNNKILRHPLIPNIDEDVNINDRIKCRITINDSYYFLGLIKVTGVSGYGETPSHYDCVFYGSNINWAEGLSNSYMDELDWGSYGNGLEYNKTSIMNTWQHEDCDAAYAASDPPIVYPITSYGEFNPDGEPSTIQLLDTRYGWDGLYSGTLGYYGYKDDAGSYFNPEPSSDWRPAIFVKDTLEKIFKQSGDYTINSSFMNTDMFKKLVWLLPNFKYNNPSYRYENYSIASNFINGISMSVTRWDNGSSSTYIQSGIRIKNTPSYNQTDNHYDYYSGNLRPKIPISTSNLNVTLDNGSYVDMTNDYVVIGEYGYYDIKLSGIEVKIAEMHKGGGGAKFVNSIKLSANIDVITVGQSGDWRRVEYEKIEQYPHQITNTNANWCNSTNSLVTDWETIPSINGRIYLNKGDKVRLSTGFYIKSTPTPSQDFNITTFNRCSTSDSNFSISLVPERVDYGQTYDLSKVMNPGYKQLDFVKGIAHAFNLKMATDETTKTVSIEPFNSFYKDYADAIDWTYKLDRSKQMNHKWLKSDLKREVVFKYKSDSNDKKVEHRGEEYFDGIKDEYPYQETLSTSFEKGESKYENPFFAGTYNGKDQDTTGGKADNPFSACLWSENTYTTNLNRPDKGYDFLPRLLYWNKYSPANAIPFTPKQAIVQTWNSVNEVIRADASSGGMLSNIYPQATSINRDDSSSPILSYGNVNVRDYNDATGVYTSYAAGKGLFATYYKKMFEMLKLKPRVRTAFFDLKTKDIVSLDFRKLVYIDGVYWRINKVIDYQPNKNQSTKVELVEWFNTGVFAATAPSFSGGTSNWGGVHGGYGDPAPDDSDNMGL